MGTGVDNRYKDSNLSWKIDGYMAFHPMKSKEQLFDSAKAELVANLKKDAAHAEAITFETYEGWKRRDFKA